MAHADDLPGRGVPDRAADGAGRGCRVRILLLGLAIPIQAIIVPLYLIIYKLHLYDTLFALMLTMTAAAIPISVLIMVNFVRDIPRELIGAMLIDGGSEWTVFRRLIGPLSRPVLATLTIYDGLNVWNNFILPLVLTRSNSVAVLPLGLTKLEGLYAINVPAVMAGRAAVGAAAGGPVHDDAQAGHAQPGSVVMR